MRVVLLQNSPTEDFGWYLEWLQSEGHRCLLLHAYESQDFPALDAFDAVYVGGTPHSAQSFCADPRFRRQWRFLRSVMAADKACFGAGSGGQVLARLLGGRVRRIARPEIGLHVVRATEPGQSDPLFEGFPSEFPAFQWYRDVFELPPGAQCLASSRRGELLAFRRGRVAGVVFHLEVDAASAGAWADAYPAELRETGARRERLIREIAESELAMRGNAFRLMRNYVTLVQERRAEPRGGRAEIPPAGPRPSEEMQREGPRNMASFTSRMLRGA
jgi:GMP synthase-like glutamine amidotransferase